MLCYFYTVTASANKKPVSRKSLGSGAKPTASNTPRHWTIFSTYFRWMIFSFIHWHFKSNVLYLLSLNKIHFKFSWRSRTMKQLIIFCFRNLKSTLKFRNIQWCFFFNSFNEDENRRSKIITRHCNHPLKKWS